MANRSVNVVARLFWSIDNVIDRYILDNVNNDLRTHLRMGILFYMTDILDNADAPEKAMYYQKYDEDVIERVIHELY